MSRRRVRPGVDDRAAALVPGDPYASDPARPATSARGPWWRWLFLLPGLAAVGYGALRPADRRRAGAAARLADLVRRQRPAQRPGDRPAVDRAGLAVRTVLPRPPARPPSSASRWPGCSRWSRCPSCWARAPARPTPRSCRTTRPQPAAHRPGGAAGRRGLGHRRHRPRPPGRLSQVSFRTTDRGSTFIRAPIGTHGQAGT